MKEFLTKPVTQDEGRSLSQFMTYFGASLDPMVWVNLIEEEANEVLKAFSNEGPEQHLKELADLRYVIVGFTLVRPSLLEALVSQEGIDKLSYVDKLMGAVHEMLDASSARYTDAQLSEAFSLVHTSNMSKLGEDGKPVRRADGKIMKGPHYKAPDLSLLVAA